MYDGCTLRMRLALISIGAKGFDDLARTRVPDKFCFSHSVCHRSASAPYTSVPPRAITMDMTSRIVPWCMSPLNIRRLLREPCTVLVSISSRVSAVDDCTRKVTQSGSSSLLPQCRYRMHITTSMNKKNWSNARLEIRWDHNCKLLWLTSMILCSCPVRHTMKVQTAVTNRRTLLHYHHTPV